MRIIKRASSLFKCRYRNTNFEEMEARLLVFCLFFFIFIRALSLCVIIIRHPYARNSAISSNFFKYLRLGRPEVCARSLLNIFHVRIYLFKKKIFPPKSVQKILTVCFPAKIFSYIFILPRAPATFKLNKIIRTNNRFSMSGESDNAEFLVFKKRKSARLTKYTTLQFFQIFKFEPMWIVDHNELL